MLIITEHAKQRIEERILMTRKAILDNIEYMLENQFYSHKPPKWYNGNTKNNTIWVSLKDLDGDHCAAVIDKENNTLVTIIKNERRTSSILICEKHSQRRRTPNNETSSRNGRHQLLVY